MFVRPEVCCGGNEQKQSQTIENTNSSQLSLSIFHLAAFNFIHMKFMCILHNLVSNYVTISRKHLLSETHTVLCFNSRGKLHMYSLVGEIGISSIVVPVIKGRDGGKFCLPKLETQPSQNHITITQNSRILMKTVMS
jgi:hypothetical protein